MKSNCKVRGLALLLGGALIVGLIASGVGAADSDSGSPHEVVTVYEPHRGGDVKVLKATPPDLPSPEEVVEQYDTRKIRINDRHSPGQIVEVTSQGEIIDMEDTRGVRSFVTSFTYSRGLWGKVRYFGIDPDGTPRVGVVSREVIEEFQGLGIPVRLEIIDLDEVMPLKEAAREIGEKWYVMGASYNHATGRVHVSLVKPNWHRYVEVYQQYPDLPLWFNLDDSYPPPLAEPRDELPDEITDTWPDISYGGGEETSDGGGEEIGVTQVTSHGGGEEIDVFHPHYPVRTGHMGLHPDFQPSTSRRAKM